ncbi:family A G protein-coupled receptor-like protein [Cutaneotrichosporon oleaginosum]|uniref:Family A G protein-coupled receptor-like protein n=1 Tax=Cutaneotrichosporon oleaginosum TaxID=879819 RepID=A0A0J0XST7_9TREE|nr:family A G protein-coupled receptor-like protein [Cutaneotrichosporon oleaginosum]KLT44138.1 family A G protein-coupled receptor-like protein [Cutaneotrichosporon oleaginosum]TXT09407.1 hypothetical protein COLE_03341 [Cutaneotrichosporon oleaginosum]
MYLNPALLARDSLDTNPPVGVVAFLSRNGSKWLWAVTAIYMFALLGFMAWAATVKTANKGFRRGGRTGAGVGDTSHTGMTGTHTGMTGTGTHTGMTGTGTGIATNDAYDDSGVGAGAHVGGVGVGADAGHHDGIKKYHNIAIMILALGAVAYFLMASNLGYTGILTEFDNHTPANVSRQVWYVRWVYYILTMPLMTLLFALHARAPLSDLLLACFMGAAWPAALLIGALIRTSYKWGPFVFAVVFFVYKMYLLAVPCRRVSSSTYMTSLGVFFLFGILYHIAWGCSEGGNVISTTSEMVWYGVLDLLFKPFFLAYFLFAVRKAHTGRMKNRHAGTGVGTGVGTGMTDTTAGTHASPRLGKKMFGRRGHHDAPMTEKPVGTGMTGTGPMATGTGPMGTGTGTGMMGGTGTGVGHTGVGHTDGVNTGVGGLGHHTGVREANPRLSEQTAVSDHRHL